SKLPTLMCDSPETPVVNTSAEWTAAEANFGGNPYPSNTALEVAPYAIPNAPSTICARNPASTNQKKVAFTCQSLGLAVGRYFTSKMATNASFSKTIPMEICFAFILLVVKLITFALRD